MTQARGKFITFEGGEGAGKSTNILYAQEYLESKGIKTQLTREPGGTPLAEEIRNILISNRSEKVDELTELLLVFSARSQHLNTLITPALEQGLWVLCDRFTDATYAYQGAGRGLSVSAIETLESLVQGQLRPDLTLLLDLDIEVGAARARNRGALDRFESLDLEFFVRVRESYLQRAKSESYYKVIDANQTLNNVKLAVKNNLEDFIRQMP